MKRNEAQGCAWGAWLLSEPQCTSSSIFHRNHPRLLQGNAPFCLEAFFAVKCSHAVDKHVTHKNTFLIGQKKKNHLRLTLMVSF